MEEAFLLKRCVIGDQPPRLRVPQRQLGMALHRPPRADSRYMEEAHRLPVVVFFYLEAGGAHRTRALRGVHSVVML